jgi:hypothetical protein
LKSFYFHPFSIDYIYFLHPKNCKYCMYYTMRLNKHYFIIRCSDIIFFDYPTFFMVLVAIQSSIDSQAIGGLQIFHVVGPRLACLKLHIVFVWVFQTLLSIIHLGPPNICLTNFQKASKVILSKWLFKAYVLFQKFHHVFEHCPMIVFNILLY